VWSLLPPQNNKGRRVLIAKDAVEQNYRPCFYSTNSNVHNKYILDSSVHNSELMLREGLSTAISSELTEMNINCFPVTQKKTFFIDETIVSSKYVGKRLFKERKL